jgi:hypothetical protein
MANKILGIHAVVKFIMKGHLNLKALAEYTLYACLLSICKFPEK